MSIQRQRLLALIDYVQQSVKLRTKLVPNVVDHGRFLLLEHQLVAVDAVRLNDAGQDGADEVWLSVPRPPGPRLPPEPDNPWLAPWLNVGVALLVAPRLAGSVEGAALIAAGTHRDVSRSPDNLATAADPAVDPAGRIELSRYDFRAEVERQYARYLESAWQPWAEAERRRRRLARLYVQLFTLHQEMSGAISEAQVELVWGVGLGVWRHGVTTVAYPLITRLVDLSFNPQTGAAEVRPRDLDPRLELDFYAAVDRPGVAQAEKLAREYLARATTTLSPFEADTYGPLLDIAKNCLNSTGELESGAILFGDLALAQPDDQLKVSRSWVLFARPRSTNVLVQDLDKFTLLLRNASDAPLPEAVSSLVTEPAAQTTPVVLPAFRGVSAGATAAGDLCFPKPFNDEQVRVVQLLETHDGVVVQGPPGTGKTHTIANIICHWLASGRRVLVTSMQEPALAVLRDQLPEELRPLAIALLASEHEGIQQFEESIQRIATGVQSIDPAVAAREIARLQETIGALHVRITRIDTDVSRWARLNLLPIDLGGDVVDPLDAAQEVVAHSGVFEWLPDRLGAGPQYAPRFGDEDLVQLEQARRHLGEDVTYAACSLPSPAAFPDTTVLVQAHQDLLRSGRITAELRNGELPVRVDASADGAADAQALAGQIERVRALRAEIAEVGKTWVPAVRERLRAATAGHEFGLLEGLGRELEQAGQARRAYLARPVTVPPPDELASGFVQAVDNLAQGKRPFGFGGVFGRAAQTKRTLDSVRVGGQVAVGAGDWQHVAGYLALQSKWRELAQRWNTLAPELGLETVAADDPNGGLAASSQYALYKRVKALVVEEAELVRQTTRVFPAWAAAYRLDRDPAALAELERVLVHQQATQQLSQVWAVKERMQRALEGTGGRVSEDIRAFVAGTLGDPAVDEGGLLARWSALMAELARVRALAPQLAVVAEVTQRIADSGAPQLAQRLRRPADTREEPLQPERLRAAWRLRRLATHLAMIDSQDEFEKLARLRRDLEHDLARAYHDLVVARTWLKLAENATPRARAALQAYLNAVQKIGKGTGKRAVRYRQDARAAAADANHAVPCWIMPHYRVSESLPAELGCFDLVIIDEASQSDLSALPALLRAQKILIVGDDRQVSPEGVGMEEEKVKSLMQRFLSDQVPLYRAQMSPERSVYDLAKVVFARSGVMLKEHFRCVAPIIEYSKREFYHHELRPLRLPRPSERLDPPLVDVFIEDGERKDGLNPAEIEFIVQEIARIASDPRMARRSIGVVSLLGEDQALKVWDRLADELGPQALQRHTIACGDARTFQGKERDIMFLSMVCAPNDVGAPLAREMFAQRFNVAGSRARDRMYLVRSVALEHLSESDRLRRGLLAHFSRPFLEEEARVDDPRDLCSSFLERELYDWLVLRRYRVTPQVRVGGYRIDLVVEGANNDARLAVECDGDKHGGPESWAEEVRRQRVLERAGWPFWRCFAASFVRRREAVLADLTASLAACSIEPDGIAGGQPLVLAELRRVRMGTAPPQQPVALPLNA
jgi:very-short-patch-repair endonuclease